MRRRPLMEPPEKPRPGQMGGAKKQVFFFFGDYYGQRVGIYDGYILYIYMYWLNLDLLDFVFTFSHWCIQHLEILLVNMYT